jgi:hypothetical protein
MESVTLMIEPDQSPWLSLGLREDAGEREIKRAYARLLKQCRPEDDPAAFQQLRRNYEFALFLSAQARERQEAGEPESLHLSTPPAAADEWPAAAPAGPTPALRVEFQGEPLTTAYGEGLWRCLVEEGSKSFGPRLNALLDSPAMQSLSVREGFETAAANYACAPEAAADIRAALVEQLRWQEEFPNLAREGKIAVHQALSRFRADMDRALLEDKYGAETSFQLLTAATHPESSRPLNNRAVTNRMKLHCAGLRHHHPDFLEHFVVPEVFLWWEENAHAKRYFTDTAFYSALTGLVLALLAAGIAGAGMDTTQTALLTIGVFVACMGLPAFYLIKVRDKFVAVRSKFVADVAGPILHVHRPQRRWQFGWMALFLPVSMLLFIPDPGDALFWSVTGMLSTCVLLAVFARSMALNAYGFFLVGAMAIYLSAMALNATIDDGWMPVAWLAFACVILASVRVDENMLVAFGMAAKTLRHLSIAWALLATGLLTAYIASDAAIPYLHPLTWSLACLGVPLGRFFRTWWSLGMLVVLPVAVRAFIVPDHSGDDMFVMTFLTYTLIFVLIGLARSINYQRKSTMYV